MSVVNHFKARVFLLMRQQGMTQTEFADALGRSRPYVRKQLEQADPKLSLLQEIADVLACDPNELLKEVTPEEYGAAFMPHFDDDED